MGRLPTSINDMTADKQMTDETAYEEARLCAHRIVRKREKTTHELRTRLIEKGHDSDVSQQVVDRFIDVGLVDDQRYIELYIREAQHNCKGWRRIKHELRQRGIADADIELLESPSDEEELERALTVIERQTITDQKDRERALRKLQNKGYSFDIAKQALAKIS
ncbi:MAG: recombination regulator RecX [Coriobacteriia bacterium]|nr:recombination regulator RecX [Coriobacteriia bacterium]